ncbi:hypothetical protein SLEP1_g53161 [Rubroshorea leprosula]|uniref:Uncharacterized protein n=1 Tax=Rubroshorea leprosula TaxID=152421 RepID=A0AAV5M9K3_9ROSI|nr:hypothetical protein SLEP1_g53161 [Rubroshorea leprosula]
MAMESKPRNIIFNTNPHQNGGFSPHLETPKSIDYIHIRIHKQDSTDTKIRDDKANHNNPSFALDANHNSKTTEKKFLRKLK